MARNASGRAVITAVMKVAVGQIPNRMMGPVSLGKLKLEIVCTVVKINLS